MSETLRLAGIGTSGDALLRLSDVLRQEFGRQPDLHGYGGFGGPNNTLHVVLSPTLWRNLAVAGLSLYIGGFIAAAGEDSWQYVKDMISPDLPVAVSPNELTQTPIYKIAQIARDELAVLHHAFVLSIDLGGGYPFGIEIREGTPDEVARAIAVLSVFGPILKEKIVAFGAAGREWSPTELNRDMRSIHINVAPNGTASVVLMVKITDTSNWNEVEIVLNPTGEVQVSDHVIWTQPPPLTSR